MVPLVSIVIPIYNMDNSLESCIRAILKQDYSNFELILVDDGSTDNSLAICNKLKSTDSRIKVIHTENKGAGPARNIGIKNSTGRYIFFPDADDKVEDSAISVLVNAMDNGKYDTVVFGYQSVNRRGKVVIKKVYPEAYKDGTSIRANYSNYMGATRKYGIQGAPWNKFFDLELIKRNNIKYPSLRRHQDEGFIAKYMCYAKNVHFIGNILYIHYLNDLKTEWDKYPMDYINTVIELNKIKKETILLWNKEDILTQNLVVAEYISNIIKALELSFSPKMNLNKQSRRKWITNNVNKAGLLSIKNTNELNRYHRIVLWFINRNINFAIILMHFKVILEKRGIIDFLKRRKRLSDR